MTTTSSSKDSGRTQKGKRRSVSNATSPNEEVTSNLNGGEQSSNGLSNGRGGKRVRDEQDEIVDEKRPRVPKKGAKATDESDMAVDGEGDGDEDGGDTRCVCGKGDSDEGGLMVMCETCKVWQHTQCMEIAEDEVPEHYYCEICQPSLHTELLKKLAKPQRRPRRRSSATRTIQKPISPSPSPPIMTKTLGKRRLTMNSRASVYDEEMQLAIQASMDAQDNEDEEEVPVMIVGPNKRRKRTAPASVHEPEPTPPAKASRSESVTSENPAPVQEMTPVPDATEAPDQPAPEPSDEEVQLPVPAPQRGKRGGPTRKITRKHVTPSVLDDNDDAPSRNPGKGRQPNQYSRRGGHTGAKRGVANQTTTETNKRLTASNNNNNNKSTRPASPPPFLTTWHLPDHLSHLQTILPSEIPEPLDIRTGAGVETTQERGVKVKWPTKRMTMGDMNKRVRNILEYVTREQMLLAERQARVSALDEAIASGRYRPLTPDPVDSMDVDAPMTVDEDVKPVVGNDGDETLEPKPSITSNKTSRLPSSEPSTENPT
ncbi:hypothetical protein CPB86DRAFT_755021, partial [Serendipita vermifera]